MSEISAHRVESGIHQYTLRPKERKTRAQVPWVFLDIDPAGHDLRAMELELKDKSRIRTVFQHPRINVKLPPALFERGSNRPGREVTSKKSPPPGGVTGIVSDGSR